MRLDRAAADARCRKSTLKGMASYVKEHYPNASYGVYPIENDSKIAVIIVANKYSPSNYWWVESNGRGGMKIKKARTNGR